MISRLALSLTALFGFWSSAAHAEPLRIDRSAEAMRVDGALKEWRGARFSALGAGDDAHVRFALATADQALYVAAELSDDTLTLGDDGDALVLTLVMPEARGSAVTELWLYPGSTGRKARALLAAEGRARAEPRVQIVEGPRTKGSGYVIEAQIPWAVVRGAEIWEQGRGSLRFRDVDTKQAHETLATATARSPSELPRLVLGAGQTDLLGSFLQAKRLSPVEPRYDFRADVSGDARPERVVVLDAFVVVYGPGYRKGETYGYFALPFGSGGGLKSAALRDLTGDGRAELLVTLRQQNQLGGRELWQVLGLDDDTIAPMFAIELKKERKGGFVESTLALVDPPRGKQGVPRIDVEVGRAHGLDALTYPAESTSDAEPILLPWGDVQARSYAYDGKRFAVVAETKRAPDAAPSAAARAAPVPAKSPPAPAVALAEAPRTGELLAMFKAQQKLPRDEAPSRTLRANVLGGAAPEQIDVFGRVLVLTGADVGQGTSYLSYVAPVSDARDLRDVRTSDVTGDQRAELLMRVRQDLTGAEGVERELLIVLHADAEGRLVRVLTAEVARRQGERAIENRVIAERGALAIEPGRAQVWSKGSYPFAPDAPSDVAPLLLPWRDRLVRYQLSGRALVATR